MPIPMNITVENPTELLETGLYGTGAVIRLQWSATETGSFVDVTGTGSTPTIALVAAQRVYPGRDPNGTGSLWYRTRFENVGATRLSDWSDPFQVGGEAGGQLCSIYDVRQRLEVDKADTTADEDLIEFIFQTSAEIQNYTGRQFAKIPSSGEKTYLFDIAEPTSVLRIPPGIASMSLLEVATISQPETGGTYSTIPTGEWMLRPVVAERDFGWPATSVIIDWRRASVLPFFPWGRNVVRATMALGWAAVPRDIQAVALNSVVRHWKARQTGQSEVIGTDAFGGRLLRFISPEERDTLDLYRVRSVG
jgi:hypothetical protein